MGEVGREPIFQVPSPSLGGRAPTSALMMPERRNEIAQRAAGAALSESGSANIPVIAPADGRPGLQLAQRSRKKLEVIGGHAEYTRVSAIRLIGRHTQRAADRKIRGRCVGDDSYGKTVQRPV